MEDLEQQFRRVALRLTTMANSQTVVGKPIEQGTAVAIPLCEVTFGFGGGLGAGHKERAGKAHGGGSGVGVAGGLLMRPKAVLVVDKDGTRMVSLEVK